MMNLIKADLYRLKRSRTFRGCLIACLAFVAFTVYVFSDSEALYLLTRWIDEQRYGFIITNVKSHESLFGFYQSFLGFTILYCFLQLFLVTDLTTDPYRLGIYKNVISYGHSRAKIYLSNLITIFISLLSLIGVTLLASSVLWCLIAPPTFQLSSDELQLILKTTPVIIWTLFAMSSFYTFLSTLIKQKTIIVGIGVLYFVYLSAMLLEVLPDSVINNIPLFMLMNLCGSVSQSQDQLGHYLWISSLIIIVTTALGIFIFKKQELK